jgi:hypothetical protein
MTYDICCCGFTENSSFCSGIGFNTTIDATVTNSTDNNSSDGSIVLDISGTSNFYPSMFSWTGPMDFTSTDKNIYNLNPGLYTLVFNNGCSEIEKKYVIANEECEGELSITGDVTCIVDDVSPGSISLIVGGGTPPYSYIWSESGYSGPNINLGQNQQGTYSVTVYDDNFCVETAEFHVAEVPEIQFTVDIIDKSDCPNEPMYMEATVIVTEGSGPFTYQWFVEDNPGPHTDNFVYIPPQNDGSYTVVVSDNCGVSKSVSGVVRCMDYSCDEENECIEVYRRGASNCSDFCDDIFENELFCDRIMIKCNCDDGAERVV